MSKPFLDRFAQPADDNSKSPSCFYDPMAEILRRGDGREIADFELTGSELTKTTTDPTSDEATDRWIGHS